MSGRRAATAVAIAVGALVLLVGVAFADLVADRRLLARRAAAAARAAGWADAAEQRIARLPPPADIDGEADADALASADAFEEAIVGADRLDDLLRAGYEFRVTRVDEDEGGRARMVAASPGSTSADLPSPATAVVQLPRQRWSLALAPRGGWHAGSSRAVNLLLAAIAALVAAVVAHDLARRPARWRRDVERVEGRLSEVRRRLADETSRREQAEDRLGREAFRDALTGLPNRANFLDRLGRALERARRRPGYELAVIFLDLDRFKTVNDSLGHGAGDQLLAAAARRFESCVRPQDLVARLGGDEFAMLLFDIGEEAAAMAAAERVLAAFAASFTIDGQEIFVTVSVGVAVSSSGYDRAEELLREADIAMYQAKAQGRARAARIDPATRDLAASVLELDRDLRHAIEREEFRLRFQPIVSLATGRLAGMEVLVRWEHPAEGLVAPGGFIHIAEETGLIVAIDRWVLRAACRQARAWLDRSPPGLDFYLSVNLSGRDLRQPDLADFVAEVLSETALPAGVLRLEVTESVVLANVAATGELVAALRRMGVSLLLDDFGTGYSSLSYLHRFQFEVLKIDRSFVHRVGSDAADAGIVRAIVRLAEELGLETIGEGVENVEEAHKLRELGCDYGQGYYFSKPLEAAAAEELLLSRQRWEGVAELKAG